MWDEENNFSEDKIDEASIRAELIQANIATVGPDIGLPTQLMTWGGLNFMLVKITFIPMIRLLKSAIIKCVLVMSTASPTGAMLSNLNHRKCRNNSEKVSFIHSLTLLFQDGEC